MGETEMKPRWFNVSVLITACSIVFGGGALYHEVHVIGEQLKALNAELRTINKHVNESSKVGALNAYAIEELRRRLDAVR